MINGCPTPPFKMVKDIRQGDPMPSSLFTLVSESLTYVIIEAQHQGLINGLRIGKNNILLTNLQFADDTLVFIPRDSHKLLNFKRLLNCFSIMTGLSINYSKSSLVIWPRNTVSVNRMSEVIGCKKECLPTQYLGMPLGVNSKLRKFWKLVIDKIDSRLSMWKTRTLYKAGKLQLIKTLNSLP